MANLRIDPIQGRSLLRLSQLRAAAQSVIKDVGHEHFTTTNIAQVSGASIGTVYRYFPDRMAVLNDLYPDRVTVLEPRLGEPGIVEYEAAVQEAYSALNDASIQNPRERLRQARAALEKVAYQTTE